MSKTTVESCRLFIEHAPQAKCQHADLAGWKIEDGFICANCAARIMARGCRINGDAIWKDKVLLSHVCSLCN